MAGPEIRYNAANEQSILAAAILDPRARATLVRTVGDSEFLVPEHPPIWRALLELENRHLVYDAATVAQILTRDPAVAQADQVLGYLDTLARQGVPENLEWRVQVFRWDATRARLAQGAVAELIAALVDAGTGPDRVAGIARGIAKAVEDQGHRAIHRPGVLAQRYNAEIAIRRASPGLRWPSGYESMDACLSEGLAPGNTTVLAGVPGSGKTTLAVALIIRAARAGRRTLYCCWEMNAVSIMDVGVSHLTRIPLTQILQGNLSEDERSAVRGASAWIARHVQFMANPFARIRSTGRGRRTNDDNLSILEGYVAEAGADLVAFDLWERCLLDLSPEGVTGALYRQQQMHEEYGFHGVIVQQLRFKDLEKRNDKRPTREAVKGSGAYVEIADLALGAHRPALFKACPDNALEVICMKQRKGRPSWAVALPWDGARCGIDGPGEEIEYNPAVESAVGDVDVGGVRINRGGRGKKS